MKFKIERRETRDERRETRIEKREKRKEKREKRKEKREKRKSLALISILETQISPLAPLTSPRLSKPSARVVSLCRNPPRSRKRRGS
ncbi:hypothetical protein FCV66_13995 [Enterovibrio norvegicus]|nr:hypothetical protein FCV66_13995 [Enterovibrio norvegicus]